MTATAWHYEIRAKPAPIKGTLVSEDCDEEFDAVFLLCYQHGVKPDDVRVWKAGEGGNRET